MRILLYESELNRYSLTALLASIEQDGLVGNFDIKVLKLNEQTVLPREHQPTYHCFSFFSAQVPEIREKIERLRSQDSDSVFVAGGPHASGDPISTLSIGFDYVFVGEAEEVFPRFLREGAGNVKIIRGKAVNLDNYQAWSLIHRRFSPLEITRGCPYACRFCQTSYLFGTKPRHRSIENILKHVEIFRSSGMRDLRFITPNALSYGSKDGKTAELTKVEELLRSIKQAFADVRIFFGTFPSEIRPEHLTEEALEIIKRYASNRALTIGAQSGSDTVLERIHRGHSTDDVFKAVERSVKKGFTVNVDFIFGLPEETEKEQLETVKFMSKLLELGERGEGSVRIHSHYFMPLPGTPYYKAEPSALSKSLTQYLGSLFNRGAIFGQWHLQRDYCKKIRESITT